MASLIRSLVAALWLALAGSLAAAAETVTLGSSEYPPYFGSSLPQGGVIAEIARQALQRRGYELRIEWYPWARALKSARDGGVDGLLGVWLSSEREQWLAYSLPLPSNQIGFFERADRPISFSGLSELKGRRIGAVRGYLNPQAFDDAKLRVEETSDDETNLRMLAAGRVELILIDKGVAQYLLRTTVPQLQGKLKWQEPALQTLPLYVAFVKRSPRHDRLLQDFNRGLKELERDGTLQRLVSQAGL